MTDSPWVARQPPLGSCLLPFGPEGIVCSEPSPALPWSFPFPAAAPAPSPTAPLFPASLLLSPRCSSCHHWAMRTSFWVCGTKSTKTSSSKRRGSKGRREVGALPQIQGGPSQLSAHRPTEACGRWSENPQHCPPSTVTTWHVHALLCSTAPHGEAP